MCSRGRGDSRERESSKFAIKATSPSNLVFRRRVPFRVSYMLLSAVARVTKQGHRLQDPPSLPLSLPTISPLRRSLPPFATRFLVSTLECTDEGTQSHVVGKCMSSFHQHHEQEAECIHSDSGSSYMRVCINFGHAYGYRRHLRSHDPVRVAINTPWDLQARPRMIRIATRVSYHYSDRHSYAEILPRSSLRIIARASTRLAATRRSPPLYAEAKAVEDTSPSVAFPKTLPSTNCCAPGEPISRAQSRRSKGQKSCTQAPGPRCVVVRPGPCCRFRVEKLRV